MGTAGTDSAEGAKPDVPPAVQWIARTLEDAGFETWAVGGAVRGYLRGKPTDEWDLATRAPPPEIQRLFKRTVPVGIEHGTVGVLSREGVLHEVTTFRRDVETFGRRAVVEFADTLDDDLSRRDFTINAIALHPLTEDIRDPFDGQGDLARGILRTVGEPDDRFGEDYLRILRALRFAGTLGMTIEADTWRALTKGVGQMGLLSPERLRDELEKVFGADAPPSRSLALYAASGALAFLYPEIDGLRGTRRGEVGDWFAHSLRVVDVLPRYRTRMRWAALLHGVGERDGTMGAGEEGSEAPERGLRRSAALLERLRSSNALTRFVAHLAAHAAYPPDENASDAEIRRWLSRVGRESLGSLLRIWAASVRADEAYGGPWSRARFFELYRHLRGIVRSGVPLTVGELSFDGGDLIRMGYRPGPRFGLVLDHLLDCVLDDPTMDEPERLGVEARRWLEEAGR